MAIIYMVGTEESVKSDAYIDGPTPNKQSLINFMKEGDILIGKDRTFERKIVYCKKLVNGKLEDFDLSNYS
jgi:hypothetical protein